MIQTIVPKKGMMLDTHISSMTEEGYIYALNAVLEQDTGNSFVLQNDLSNILATVLPDKSLVIGHKLILEHNKIIVLLITEKSFEFGEISLLSTNPFYNSDINKYESQVEEPIKLEHQLQKPFYTYTSIVDLPCLGLSKYHSVDIEYKLTDCQLQLYFVDGFNPDRYIYFTFNSIEPYIVQDTFKDCNKLNIQPDYTKPKLEIDSIVTGGNLSKGVYQFLVAYATANNEVLTSYTAITQPVFIQNDLNQSNIQNTDGTLQATTKAIKLKINLSGDTPYNYFNLAVIETNNNISQYKLVGTFPVTQSSYIYTGNETAIKLDENVLLQKYPYYKHSKSVTKANNYLFRGNVIEYRKPNLQRVANLVSTKWQTIILPEDAYKDPILTNKYRTYQRDEVISVGIVFGYTNGEETPVYTIPGRQATIEDRLFITIEQEQDSIKEAVCSVNNQKEYWQVYNTAKVTKTYHTPYQECRENLWEEGDFSYWESTDLYPDNNLIWGDLANKPIRHHKMPDCLVTHIHNSLGFTDPDKEIRFQIPKATLGTKSYIFPIGIKIEEESIYKAIEQCIKEGLICRQDADRISSYKIVRGNRAGNKSIIAKGLLYDMWSYKKKEETYYYPNYPYNDLNDDRLIASNDFYLSDKSSTNSSTLIPNPNKFQPSKRYTFHSPDTHFTQPALGNVLKLETQEIGRSQGYFDECLEHPKYKLMSPKTYGMANWFGAFIADNTKINKETEQQTSNLGASIGSTVGAIAGGPIGAGIGSAAGALLGGLFANNIGGPAADLAKSITKMSLALVNSEKFLDLVKNLTAPRQYQLQYNSFAKYNTFLPVLNEGFKQRQISSKSYLLPNFQSINEESKTILINNYNRESSVYLKLSDYTSPFRNPSFTDTSRTTLKVAGQCLKPLNNISEELVSSYYASIKSPVLNQYGSVYTIDYIETSGQWESLKVAKYLELINNSYLVDATLLVEKETNNGTDKLFFGGDTYITRFSLKRKLPFFLTNTFRLPEDTDFYYSDFANVGYPIYYFNTQTKKDYYIDSPAQLFQINRRNNIGTLFQLNRGVIGLPDITSAIGDSRKPEANLQCTDILTDTVQNWIYKGYMYLYYYGIPTFFVESDVNTELREHEDSFEKDYYPHNTNLKEWLQEKNVPIRIDNFYKYDNTFSKQIKESALFINTPSFNPAKDCLTSYPNRVIYSEPSSTIDTLNNKDSWLYYKANNYYDFSKVNGRLISIEGIENNKVLARFENTTEVYNAYLTLNTNADTIQVGTGGLFQTKPQEYAHTELGYIGTQHKAILQTEFGLITVDAKRGQIFLLNNSGVKELSNEQNQHWFQLNLPFQLLKYISNLPDYILDNNYIGVGLILYFDKFKKRIFITKRDYRPLQPIKFINATDVCQVKDNPVEGFYLINKTTINGIEQEVLGNKVELSNKQYFEDVSWTISYSFIQQDFTSFHSFKPDYAVSFIDQILLGANSKLWSQGLLKSSFGVYQGISYPFIVDVRTKLSPLMAQYQSVSLNASVSIINYRNNLFRPLSSKPQSTVLLEPFNKAIVYTDFTNTGLLNLKLLDKHNQKEKISYPKNNKDSTTIELSNQGNDYYFNTLFNRFALNQYDRQSFMWFIKPDTYYLNEMNILYGPLSFLNKRLYGHYLGMKLIKDDNSNHKVLFNWSQIKTT